MRILLLLPLLIANVLNAMDEKQQEDKERKVAVSGFEHLNNQIFDDFFRSVGHAPVSGPPADLDSAIQADIVEKGYNNLERYGIRTYKFYNDSDLIIFSKNSSDYVENVIKSAISNLLLQKIGNTSYCYSTSIATNKSSYSGCQIIYRGFFSGSRILKSNITQDQWFNLIDAAIDRNL